MKIIAIIVALLGFSITGISSLGMIFSFYSANQAVKDSAASGIGAFASWISTAQMLSYANLLGVVILFFGIVLMIAALFMGKNKQQAAG